MKKNLVIAGKFNCYMNLSDRFPISIHAYKSVQPLENLFFKCKLTDSWQSFNSGMYIHIIIKNITISVAITQPVKNPGYG